MGDGVDEAPVQQRQPRDREPGIHRRLVAPGAVKHQRRAAVPRCPLAVDQRDGDAGAVGGDGPFPPLLEVPGVVAAGAGQREDRPALAQRQFAGQRIGVEDRVGGGERDVVQPELPGGILRVRPGRDLIQRLGEGDLLLAAVAAQQPQAGEAVPAEVHHEMVLECVRAQQPGVRAVRDDRGEVRGIGQRAVAGRVPQRHLRQFEVQRAVVVQDQQPAGAVRATLVLDRILDPLPAGQHHPRARRRRSRVQQPYLAGQRAGDRDGHVTLAAGQPDSDGEPLVGLLDHDHVAGGRGAPPVPPYPVRAPRVVHGHVEQHGPVGGPGAAVEGAGDLVGGRLPGHQVLDPQREPLVAGEVGRVGEQPRVGADAERAQREERRVAGHLVLVQQYLLAGQRRTANGARRRVLARLDGAPAVHRVLLARDRARVVPPAALADRHGQVGLLGAALDLGEDLIPQPGLARRHRRRVGVLGFQVTQGQRVVLVGQPRVVVDDRVAVMGSLTRDPPGGGRLGRRPGGLTGRARHRGRPVGADRLVVHSRQSMDGAGPVGGPGQGPPARRAQSTSWPGRGSSGIGRGCAGMLPSLPAW